MLNLGWAEDAVWSNDGALVAVAGSAGIRIYEGSPPQLVRSFDYLNRVQEEDDMDLTFEPKEVRFSPNGQLISVWGYGGLQVFTNEGDIVLNVPGDFVWDAEFTPDNRNIAAVSLGCLRSCWGSVDVIDLDNKESEQFAELYFDENEVPLAGIAINPSGDILAAADDAYSIKVWDINTGEHLLTLEGHEDAVHEMAFNPTDGTLASISYDQTLRVWDVNSGTQLREITLDSLFPTTLEFIQNKDQVLIADKEGYSIWDTDTGSRTKRSIHAHDGVFDVHPLTDQIMMATGTSISMVNLDTGAIEDEIPDFMGLMDIAVFSPDSKFIATISTNDTSESTINVRLWETEKGGWGTSFTMPFDFDPLIKFSPDSRLVASSAGPEDGPGNLIFVWDTQTGEVLDRVNISGIHNFAFHPTEHMLAIATDNGIFFYSLTDRTLKQFSSTTQGTTNHLSFLNSGNTLISSEVEYELSIPTIRIWSTNDGEEVTTFVPRPLEESGWEVNKISGGTLYRVTQEWSPVRKSMSEVWAIESGKMLSAFQQENESLINLEVASQGDVVLGQSFLHILAWDPITGEELANYLDYDLWDISVSPDSRYLAISRGDQTIELLSLEELLNKKDAASSPRATMPPGFEVATARQARNAFEYSSARSLNRLTTPDQTLNLSESEPLLLGSGWCASSQQILEQNDIAMETHLLVNGIRVDPAYYASRDYGSDDPTNPTFCRSHYVLINSWPDGRTCLEVRLVITEPLSDGWDEYGQGSIAIPYCVYVGTP